MVLESAVENIFNFERFLIIIIVGLIASGSPAMKCDLEVGIELPSRRLGNPNEVRLL